jgi:hypothetical protein
MCAWTGAAVPSGFSFSGDSLLKPIGYVVRMSDELNLILKFMFAVDKQEHFRYRYTHFGPPVEERSSSGT